MAVGAGYLFGAAATTALAMATLYALRRFRSSFISPLSLDSAGLELRLKEPRSGPAGAIEILRSHGITIRRMDAEIDEERAHYSFQVRIKPPADPNTALAEISSLPEVARVSLTGFKDYEEQ
jgi:uncharacterized membrane protein YhiD involved in acid resistance